MPTGAPQAVKVPSAAELRGCSHAELIALVKALDKERGQLKRKLSEAAGPVGAAAPASRRRDRPSSTSSATARSWERAGSSGTHDAVVGQRVRKSFGGKAYEGVVAGVSNQVDAKDPSRCVECDVGDQEEVGREEPQTMPLKEKGHKPEAVPIRTLGTARATPSAGPSRERSGPSNGCHAVVGQRVCKSFDGRAYEGVVARLSKADVSDPWWLVKYDDGDQEDVSWDELKAMLLEKKVVGPEAQAAAPPNGTRSTVHGAASTAPSPRAALTAAQRVKKLESLARLVERKVKATGHNDAKKPYTVIHQGMDRSTALVLLGDCGTVVRDTPKNHRRTFEPEDIHQWLPSLPQRIKGCNFDGKRWVLYGEELGPMKCDAEFESLEIKHDGAMITLKFRTYLP